MITTSMNRILTALIVVLAFFAFAPHAQAAPGNGERYRTIDGVGGKLRVSDGGGGGVPVIFVHDLGSDLEAWRAQLDHVRRERRAIAYDQRGHGGSDRARDGVYTIASLSSDLDRVVEALGLDRFYLVGHGMAGAVLTTYAAAHPDKVAGLAYAEAIGDAHGVARQRIDATLLRYESGSFGKRQLRDEFSKMLDTGARPATKKLVLSTLDRFDLPAYAALRRSVADFSASEFLSRYHGPRMAIEAENRDSPASFSAFDRSAPRVTLQNVSHWLMIDDPKGFDRALDAFIGLKSN